MKEIKAYVHRHRIADVVAALKASTAWSATGDGDHNLTVYMVKGSLLPVSDAERSFSVEVGDEVINEYKVELHCSDAYVDELVHVIDRVARTGQVGSGWIYVTEIERAIPIGTAR